MLVLVGSTRPAKVEGVRDAIAAISQRDARFASAELVPRDLTTVAPRMPMSIEEIVEGARTRARALREGVGSSDRVTYAVGVEGGLAQLPATDLWTLQTWVVISDGDRWSYGGGPSLQLPARVAGRVLSGEELGDVVDDLAARSVRGTQGAWGVLTLDLIDRRDAFRLAALAAFAPFYNADAW
jgi:inosine/xanthosine triphosphatase